MSRLKSLPNYRRPVHYALEVGAPGSALEAPDELLIRSTTKFAALLTPQTFGAPGFASM